MQEAPLKLLERAVKVLKKHRSEFAVAGGLAASVYRIQPRVTNDVDIVLLADPDSKTEEVARCVIKELDLKPVKASEAQLKKRPSINKRNSPTFIIVGRREGEEVHSGLDIMLPTMPWVTNAVKRAQLNHIDFGFETLPAITPEDLIIAKAWALRDNPSRFKDLDDLKEIFTGPLELEAAYLFAEFEKHDLTLPRVLKKIVGKRFRRIIQKIPRREPFP